MVQNIEVKISFQNDNSKYGGDVKIENLKYQLMEKIIKLLMNSHLI